MSLTLMLTPQSVQSDQLRVPRPMTLERDFFGDPANGNDIFIIPNNDILTQEGELQILSPNGGDVHSTFLYNRVFETDPSQNDPFFYDLFGPDRLLQIANQSANPLNVRFRTEVNDIIIGNNGNSINGTNLIEDVLLYEDEPHGFRFFVDENHVMKPIVINTQGQSSDNFFTLEFRIQSPSGATDTLNVSFETNDPFSVPIVPNEVGLHTLLLEPTTETVILDHLALLDDFDIEEVENGCIHRFVGPEQEILFFQINPPGYDGTPGILDVNSLITHPRIIQTSGFDNDLLGGVDFQVFTPGDPFGFNPFGFNPQDSIFHNGNTIVSVQIDPPNDDNPSIAKLKEEWGVPSGADVEAAFWTEFNPIRELPLGEDILFGDDDDEFLFFFENPADGLIGINDTGTPESSGSILTNVHFFPVDDPLMSIHSDAQRNDLLNFRDVDLSLLPAGNYTVFVDTPNHSEVQINVLPFSNFGEGDRIDRSMVIDDIEFFFLSTDTFGVDLFNVTFPTPSDNLRNITAFFDFDLFNFEGQRLDDDDLTFEQISSFASIDFSVINNTEIDGFDTIRGGWLRIKHTGNQLWNGSLVNPLNGLLETDNMDIASQILIDRHDGVDIFGERNEDADIFRDEVPIFDTDQTEFLNGSASDILGYWTFNSREGGNRITMKASNMTFQLFLLTDGGESWFSVFSTNTTHGEVLEYTVDLEFGTLEPLIFGLLAIFNPIGPNGTLSANVQFIEAIHLPTIPLNHMSFTGIDGDVIDPDVIRTDLGDDGFNIGPIAGGGALAIGTAGIAIYVIRTRGISFGRRD